MITDYNNLPVLVTGANGFIGSHLARRLVQLGTNISVFVEPKVSLWRLSDIKSYIKIYPVDIADFERIKSAIAKINPVKIFHLAAFVNVDRSMDLMDKMVEVNIKGTLNILKALKQNNCHFDCMVNTGTCEEYGYNRTPFFEIQKENPISLYSSSKVAATYFCQMLNRTADMPIVTLRPFLTYGPYQVNNMLIPYLIKKCLLNEKCKMTKGKQAREFNYASDIIEGYVKAAITKKALGEIFNLGCGVEHKVTKISKLIIGLTNSTIKPEFGALPYRSGEAKHFYCSNSKAKRILKWQPKVTIIEGLKRTIEWYRRYLKQK